MKESLDKHLILSERFSKGHRRRISKVISGEASEEIHGNLSKRIHGEVPKEFLTAYLDVALEEIFNDFLVEFFLRIFENCLKPHSWGNL